MFASYNAARLPSFNTGHEGLVVLTVLIWSIDGYRAYAAIVPDNSRNDPDYTQVRDFVRAQGAKLYARDAARMFGIEEKEYAR